MKNEDQLLNEIHEFLNQKSTESKTKEDELLAKINAKIGIDQQPEKPTARAYSKTTRQPIDQATLDERNAQNAERSQEINNEINFAAYERRKADLAAKSKEKLRQQMQTQSQAQRTGSFTPAPILPKEYAEQNLSEREFARQQLEQRTGRQINREGFGNALGEFSEKVSQATQNIPLMPELAQFAGNLVAGAGQTIKAGTQAINATQQPAQGQLTPWGAGPNLQMRAPDFTQAKKTATAAANQFSQAGESITAMLPKPVQNLIPKAKGQKGIMERKSRQRLEEAEKSLEFNLAEQDFEKRPDYQNLVNTAALKHSQNQPLTDEEKFAAQIEAKKGFSGFVTEAGQTLWMLATDERTQEEFGRASTLDLPAMIALGGPTGALAKSTTRLGLTALDKGIDLAQMQRFSRAAERAQALRQKLDDLKGQPAAAGIARQYEQQIAKIDKLLEAKKSKLLADMTKPLIAGKSAEEAAAFLASEGLIASSLDLGRQMQEGGELDAEAAGRAIALNLLTEAVIDAPSLSSIVANERAGASRDKQTQAALRGALDLGETPAGTDLDPRLEQAAAIDRTRGRSDLKKAGEIIGGERARGANAEQFADNKIVLDPQKTEIQLTRDQAKANGNLTLWENTAKKFGITDPNQKLTFNIKGYTDNSGKIILTEGFNRTDYREEHLHTLQSRISKFRKGNQGKELDQDFAKEYAAHERNLQKYFARKGISPSQMSATLDEQIAKDLVRGLDTTGEAALQYSSQIVENAPPMPAALRSKLENALGGRQVVKMPTARAAATATQVQPEDQAASEFSPKPTPEPAKPKQTKAEPTAQPTSEFSPDEDADPEGQAIEPTIKGAVSGKGGRAFSEDNTPLPYKWAVIDEGAVTASIGANATNQPRDRSRAASQQQIKDLSQRMNFKLASGSGESVGSGAPVLTKDGVILAGNGRIAGMGLGYESNSKAMAAYKADLQKAAKKYGIDPAQIQGLERPILVRVTGFDSQDTDNVKRWAKVSNEEGAAQYSPAELAKQDAESLNLGEFAAEYPLNHTANANFVRKFVSQIPAKDRAPLVDAKGQLSADGEKRLSRAVLSKAYGEHPIIAEMIEATDPEGTNLLNALKAAAPAIAQAGAKELADKALEAVQFLRNANTAGMSPEEYALQSDALKQQDPFVVALAQEFKDNARSYKKLAETLGELAERSTAAADEAAPDMMDLMGLAPSEPKGLAQHLADIQADRDFGGENDNLMRFSLESPLKDRELVLTHNIKEAGLKAAYELGGIPMPSLAVAKIDNPLSGYGDITLVADPKQWKPSKETPLYAADIYSVRIPTSQIEFKFDRKKVVKKEKEIMDSLPEDGKGNFNINLEGIQPNSILHLTDNAAFQWWFATKKGLNPKPVYELNSVDIDQSFKKFLGKEPFELWESSEFKELVKALYLLDKEEKGQDFKRAEKIWDAKPEYRNTIIQNRINTLQKANQGAKKRFDYWDTQRELRELLKSPELQKELEQEAIKLMDEVIEGKRLFSHYTKTGRSYKPYTLENLAALMKKRAKESKSIRGSEQTNYGSMGAARAQVTPEIKSWDQARKMQHRIIKDAKEKWQEIEKQWENSIRSLLDRIEKDRGFRFDQGEILRAIPKMGIDQMKSQFDLQSWEAQELKDFVQELIDLPTDYFEMKSLKPVRLSEFNTAIVPPSISQESLNILEKQGLKVIKTEDKAKALEGLEDLRFSLESVDLIEVDGKERPTKNSNGQPIAQTEEGLKNFWRWFGDSKAVDADGKPVVFYHGTGEEFTKFKKGKRGIWLTTSEKAAKSYADKRNFEKGFVMPLYVKAENPAQSEYIDDNYTRFDQAGHDSYFTLDNKTNAILQAVVLSPSQLKSATKNKGSFDPNNTDIRFSLEIDVDGKKRPTTNSNGKRIAKTDEEIRNFWRWFGGSKVVDDEGRPEPLYHGSSAKDDFNSFLNKGDYTGANSAKLGYFFTDNKTAASLYAGATSELLGNGNFEYQIKAIEQEYNDLENYLNENYDTLTQKELQEIRIKQNNLSNDFSLWRDLLDEAEHIERLEYKKNNDGYLPDEFSFLNVDTSKYRPRVFVAYLKAENPFVIENTGSYKDNSYSEAIKKAIENGHDSVIMFDAKDPYDQNNVIVFDPTQIKSALGNRGTFDAGNPDIRFSLEDLRGVPHPDRPENFVDRSMDYLYASPMGKAYDSLYQALVDDFNPARRIEQQAGILDRRSAPKSNEAAEESAYVANQMRAGKVRDAIESAENLLRPIMKQLRKEGKTLEDAGEFLYAQHAPDYNREMAKINPPRERVQEILEQLMEGQEVETESETEPWLETLVADAQAWLEKNGERTEGTALEQATFDVDQKKLDRYLGTWRTQEQIDAGLSGMSTAEAKEIVKKGRQSRGLVALSQAIGQLRDKMRAEMIDSGLISFEQGQGLEKYPNYVPLKGWENETIAESMEMAGRVSGGGIGSKGLSITGADIKRAGGRVTKASNPLGHFLADYQRTIERAQRNRVANKFFELAEKYPQGPWEVWEAGMQRADFVRKPKGSPAIAKLSSIPTPPSNTISFKRFGEPVHLQIRDKALLRAMKSLDAQDSNFIFKLFAKYNRVLGALITSLNPEFMITNAIRDLQFAVLRAGTDHDARTAAKTAKDYIPALAQILKSEMGKKTNPTPHTKRLERYWKEFKEEGTLTGYTITDKAPDALKKMQAELESGFKGDALRAFRAGARQIENLNTAIESMGRLAYYAALRDQGLSPKRAAYLAKNLTINFNRKGTAGQALNSWWLFFNAAIQGNAAFLRMAKTPKGVAAIGALAAAGLLTDLANGLFGPEDEERDMAEWDKKPMQERSTNLVIMRGKDNSFDWRFPVGYGLNVPFTIGQIAGQAARRQEVTPQDAAIQTALAGINGFLPVRWTNNLVQTMTPTIGRIPVDMQVNQDFAGREIARTTGPWDTRPESQKGTDRQSVFSKNLAEFMNEATGGNDWQSGSIDPHPAQIDYVIKNSLGGLGALVGATMAVPQEITKNDLTAREVPFVRKVISQRSDFANQTDARKLGKAMGQIESRAKEDSTFAKQRPELVKLAEDYKDLTKQAKKAREEAKEKGTELDMKAQERFWAPFLRKARDLGVEP